MSTKLCSHVPNLVIMLQSVYLLALLLSSLSASVLKEAYLYHEDHEDYWDNNLNPPEKVELRIAALASEVDGVLEHHSHDYLLKNLTALHVLLPIIEWIDIEVIRPGYDRNIYLSLEKQPRLISKDLQVIYYDDDTGKEVTESLNETIPGFDPEHCSFATKPDELIVATFSLCKQISGYIDIGSEEFKLYAVKRGDDAVQHFISSKLNVEQTYDLRPRLKQNQLNVTHRIAKRALVDKYSSDKRAYVRMYFVVGYTIGNSELCENQALCIDRVLRILGVNSMYYRELNVFYVLMTLKIWRAGKQNADNPLGNDYVNYGSYTNLTVESLYDLPRWKWYETEEEQHKLFWWDRFTQYQAEMEDMQDGRTDVRVAMAWPPEWENSNDAYIAGRTVLGSFCHETSVVTASMQENIHETGVLFANTFAHNFGAHNNEHYSDSECQNCFFTNDTVESACILTRVALPPREYLSAHCLQITIVQ